MLDGNPEAEAEAAESAEVTVEGSTGFNWADASEDAPELTTDQVDVGGAASCAPGDEEDFDILKFDALSLLDPVKPKEVTAEELFEALEAEPTVPSDQAAASGLVEADTNLESDNPENLVPKEEADFSNNPDQETSAEVADPAADPIVGSSPSVVEPDPNSTFAPVYVQHLGGVAEEDEVPPPPTSPFLEQEGAAAGASTSGHVQTGHSPAGPSRGPRVRGTKGGKKAQTKKLIQRWQADFDRLANFLWDEAEFWLRYVHHSEASAELIWTVRVFRVLYNHCTLNQILVHFANTFAPYRNWVFTNGYRRGELHLAPDTAANTVLPDRDHINLQAFGDPDPPRSVWDDYNTYRGAQPKGKAKAKASVFTQNTELPSEPEQATALGVDPSLDRGVSSSEETHTPSPRGPPKAKARPKPASQPKEPDHPPPWVPSLRPAGHQSAPKVSHSVASVPPPRDTGGAAEKRPKLEKAEQASDPKASGEASVPEPPKPKASDPKVAKPPKDNPLKRLGPAPSYPAPPVPPHRDFHQTLGPPPQRPPRAATPRGDRAATAIPPPPSHAPPTAADLDRAERGRTRERAGTVPTTRTGGDHVDKSPAASAPAKPASRSRTRVPATLIPRADGSFADQDTEVLRRARGGNLGTPSLSSRPIALRPTDTKYPPVVINSEGTWVRISKPPGASGREPATVPVAISGVAASSDDPHELSDELWRDPSLLGSNTTLVTSHNTQVIPISEPEGLVAVNSESVEGVEEEEETTAPPPKRRAIGITTSSGRRQVYQSRRRSIPQPETTSTAAAPGGPPSEPEAPDEDPDPSDPGEPEGEEEEDHSSDPPEAPPEGEEEVEVEVEVEEEAAPLAPQEPSTPSQASPKAPTTRGSVSRFLSPSAESAERSRSRHRDTPIEEEAPVAVTTSSTRVSGTIQTQIFRDGTKAEVFVPDIPTPKTPPKSIGSPPPRSSSQPAKSKPPPPGVSSASRSTSVPPWREGAARAPQAGGPPIKKKYKAPPRPPYNYSITVGQAYEPGVDPDPPQPTEEELNAAWARSKEQQDKDWERHVESLADRKHRQALEAYNQSEKQKQKHNKVKPPAKQPPFVVPPRPDRPVPKAHKTASPKPSPPATPVSTPPTPPPRPPKATSSTAAAPSRGKAGAAIRAPGGRIDLGPLIRARQERGAIGNNLVVFFDWHDTLDCARNALKLFDQSILDKFINLVQIAQGRIEFHIVSFSGVARGRQTEEDANNLAEYCRSQGLPFRTVTVVNDPVGPGGKTPVLTSSGANIHIDDRQDVCEEAARANIYTIPVYKSSTLSWWPQLESAVRDHGVDYFLRNHAPVPLRGDQFSRRRN